MSLMGSFSRVSGRFDAPFPHYLWMLTSEVVLILKKLRFDDSVDLYSAPIC
jgi:hypothetical protein